MFAAYLYNYTVISLVTVTDTKIIINSLSSIQLTSASAGGGGNVLWDTLPFWKRSILSQPFLLRIMEVSSPYGINQ